MTGILIFLASLIPAGLIFLMIRNQKKDEAYRKLSGKAFLYGALSVFPVLAVAGAFALIGSLLKLKTLHPILYEVYRTFLTAAMAEEAVKFWFHGKLLRGTDYEVTWKDVIGFMTLIGLGFGVVEDIPYAIGSDIIQILVRGFLVAHADYGFIMGYFIGKAMYTGKKGYVFTGFIIPFLLHAVYDLTLSKVLLQVYEWIVFIPVTLAFVSLITIIVMVVFFLRKNKKEKYLVPLNRLKFQKHTAE